MQEPFFDFTVNMTMPPQSLSTEAQPHTPSKATVGMLAFGEWNEKRPSPRSTKSAVPLLHPSTALPDPSFFDNGNTATWNEAFGWSKIVLDNWL
jgi:hypothetical protein